MSVDESLMCSFQILKSSKKKKWKHFDMYTPIDNFVIHLFVVCLLYGDGIGSNNIRKNDCGLLKELTFWAWSDLYCSASPTHTPALFPAPFYAKSQSLPTASQRAPSVVWSFILKHAGQSAWAWAPWLAHWGQCWVRTSFSVPSPVIRC